VSYVEHSQLLMRILLIYVRNNQTYLQHKQVQQMFQVHYEIAKTHLNEQSLPLFYKYITDIDVALFNTIQLFIPSSLKFQFRV